MFFSHFYWGTMRRNIVHVEKVCLKSCQVDTIRVLQVNRTKSSRLCKDWCLVSAYGVSG